jgi:YbbR domain-containing protein
MGRNPGKNVLTKIVALILATVLWLYVTNEQNPSVEVTYQVPLEVRNVLEDIVVLDVPETVKVKLKGPRNLIAGVRAQDIKAYVDVRGLSEGKHTVQVGIALPHAMETMEVNPDKISLQLDKIVARDVPVEIRMSGALPPEVSLVKLTPAADTVTVRGPRSALDTISRVVGAIDAKGHSTTFNSEAPLTILGRDGKEITGLSPQPSKIKVEVQLAQGKLKKFADIKAVMTGEPAQGFTLKSIQFSPEKVEIAGVPQLIENIDAVSTAPINLSNISKDTEQEVKLQLPDGVTVVKDTVTARISVIKKP